MSDLDADFGGGDVVALNIDPASMYAGQLPKWSCRPSAWWWLIGDRRVDLDPSCQTPVGAENSINRYD